MCVSGMLRIFIRSRWGTELCRATTQPGASRKNGAMASRGLEARIETPRVPADLMVRWHSFEKRRHVMSGDSHDCVFEPV